MSFYIRFSQKINNLFVYWIDNSFHDQLLSQRLGRGTLWSAIGSVLSRSLTIIASIFVARLIGKEEFGEVGIIQSTILMLTSFAGFGSGIMATKFVSQYCRQHPQRAGNIIFLAESVTFFLSLIFSSLFFGFSGIIASNILASPELAPFLKVSALLLFFNTLGGTQLGILTGFEAFKKIAHINLIIGISSVIFLPLGSLFLGLSGVIWAMILVSVVNWLLNLYSLQKIYIKNNIHRTYKFNKSDLGLLWTFNFPSFLSILAFTSAGWICNAMLVNATGYDEMGIVNACNNWYLVILFFPTIISGIILPIMSERIGSNESKQTKKIVFFSIKINAFIILPFAVLLIIFSPFFMGLFGESFSSSWLPLVFTILTACLLSIQIPVGQMIAARSRMWLGFYMNLGWAILFIGFNYIFIDHGANGLVIARFIAYCIHSIWTFAWFFYVVKQLNQEKPVVI